MLRSSQEQNTFISEFFFIEYFLFLSQKHLHSFCKQSLFLFSIRSLHEFRGNFFFWGGGFDRRFLSDEDFGSWLGYLILKAKMRRLKKKQNSKWIADSRAVQNTFTRPSFPCSQELTGLSSVTRTICVTYLHICNSKTVKDNLAHRPIFGTASCSRFQK